MITPVIRTIKTQFNYGDVDLHFLTKSAFAPILAANPYLDKLFTIKRRVSEISEVLRCEH